jgi:vancomycin resistance protein YoaR
MSDVVETPDESQTPPIDEGVVVHAAPDTDDFAAEAASRRARRERSTRGSWDGSPDGSRRLMFAAGAIAAVVALLIAGDLLVSWGRIHPGVRVGSIAVGSMTPEQASVVLSEAFTSTAKTPVIAVFESERWTVSAEQVGARLDAAGSVEAAMAVGRAGGLGAMVGQRFSAVFGGVSVGSRVFDDPAKTDAVLDRIDHAVALPSRDASVSVSGGKVTLIPAELGRAVDREVTKSGLLAAFLTTSRSTTVAAVPAGVAVSDADARQAYLDAQKLVSGPVTVTYGTGSVHVPRATVAGWVRFTRRPVVTPVVELSRPATETSSATGPEATASIAPQRVILVAAFDPARVGTAIKSLTKGLGQPARNAKFLASNGSVRISPSRVGRGPDLVTLASELASACVSGTARTAAVKLVETQPKLTTAAAKEMGISDRISSFTTTYAGSSSARVNNVHKLAKALDMKLVAPGGVFSFNGAAGERTAAKGYQEAPAIVNGKLVPQLGGGVCQVGTTFFNAVFFSGLPVVERRNHSFYISHYPKGRDATVSWGGPDFKFKNDTKGWILIRTATTTGSLTISLYGTDPGYEVEYKTGAFTNVVPHKVTVIKDPKLKKGMRIVEDGGVDGCRVTVVRVVYKGGEVVRKDTFVSHYGSKEEVVRVGTKVASKPATGTVSP